jgi:Flp pilus assembly protein TadG
MRPRHRHGTCSERAAVLVELALILPLLLGLSLAVFDIGMGWRASMTVTSAARAGARVGSNLGVESHADQAALAAVSAALGSIPPAEIDLIVIYRSDGAAGGVPAACTTTTARANGGDPSARCNTYTAADLQAAVAGTGMNFDGACAGRRDSAWCSTTRNNSQVSSAGPDYLGVYVRIHHSTSTKIFGSSLTIDDHAVMRIEPNAGNA